MKIALYRNSNFLVTGKELYEYLVAKGMKFYVYHRTGNTFERVSDISDIEIDEKKTIFVIRDCGNFNLKDVNYVNHYRIGVKSVRTDPDFIKIAEVSPKYRVVDVPAGKKYFVETSDDSSYERVRLYDSIMWATAQLVDEDEEDFEKLLDDCRNMISPEKLDSFLYYLAKKNGEES